MFALYNIENFLIMATKNNFCDETAFFQEQIKESLDLIENKLYLNVDEKTKHVRSVFFDELELLSVGENSKLHNCVPCNLNYGINLIRYFLKTNLSCQHIKFFLNVYTNLLYQQAERFGVVYSKLGYVGSKNEFDWNRFPKLQIIKYWANFFKHPKSTMFLHHTTFHIESYSDKPNFLFDGVIDCEFVKKYFSGSKLNKELEEKISNKDFKVFFPDLVVFTNLICDESDEIIAKIKSNDANIEKLKSFRRKYF